MVTRSSYAWLDVKTTRLGRIVPRTFSFRLCLPTVLRPRDGQRSTSTDLGHRDALPKPWTLSP
jgi:hypothetical protein